MKTLLKLANSVGARVEVLNFWSLGKTIKGYAIIDKENNELLTVEPYFGGGDRWKVLNKSKRTLTYYKTLSGIKAEVIQAGYTGYTFRR